MEFRGWTLDAPDALEHEQVNETDKGTIAEQGVESQKIGRCKGVRSNKVEGECMKVRKGG